MTMGQNDSCDVAWRLSYQAETAGQVPVVRGKAGVNEDTAFLPGVDHVPIHPARARAPHSLGHFRDRHRWLTTSSGDHMTGPRFLVHPL